MDLKVKKHEQKTLTHIQIFSTEFHTFTYSNHKTSSVKNPSAAVSIEPCPAQVKPQPPPALHTGCRHSTQSLNPQGYVHCPEVTTAGLQLDSQ